MPAPRAIDPDLLRSFTCIAEEGSFTRAASRVGRTQAAVSMQMQRLEDLLGVRVLVRSKGGSVGLTAHGRFLLDRARDVLAANDGIWNAFREPQVAGTVRLGTPDDYALRWLPPILRGFAASHPAVEVEVVCMESGALVVPFDLEVRSRAAYWLVGHKGTINSRPVQLFRAWLRLELGLPPQHTSAAA